jgi:hypothetical protein
MQRATVSNVLDIKPSVRQVPTGWLAVSEVGSPLKIAVIGPSEGGARELFAESLNAWARLRAMPDPFGDRTTEGSA